MTKEKAEKIQRVYNWVRFIILVLFLTFVFIGIANAQSTNDFGIWTNVGIEKSIGERWNVAGSTELRTKDYSKSIDRWELATHVSYKLCKALKLGAGYEFHLKRRSVGETNEMVPRHRLMFEIAPGGKVSNWLKLSLRERYQFTHMMSKSGISASDEHHLRSRLKAGVAKSGWKWSPFLSVETFNNLCERFTLDEIRMAVGTTYNLSSHHALSIGYLCDMKGNDGNFNKVTHVMTSGYLYKF